MENTMITKIYLRPLILCIMKIMKLQYNLKIIQLKH